MEARIRRQKLRWKFLWGCSEGPSGSITWKKVGKTDWGGKPKVKDWEKRGHWCPTTCSPLPIWILGRTLSRMPQASVPMWSWVNTNGFGKVRQRESELVPMTSVGYVRNPYLRSSESGGLQGSWELWFCILYKQYEFQTSVGIITWIPWTNFFPGNCEDYLRGCVYMCKDYFIYCTQCVQNRSSIEQGVSQWYLILSLLMQNGRWFAGGGRFGKHQCGFSSRNICKYLRLRYSCLVVQ